MKKLFTLLLSLIMCLSLVACGGVDKQPAIDAFNNASNAFDKLANEINADIEAYPQELIAVMNEMADAMNEHKTILESDQELTEEQIAEMISAFAEVENWAVETEGQLEDLVVSGIDKQTVIDAFNTVSPMFDATANAVNANVEAFDEEFVNTMIDTADVLTQYKELLEGDQELTEEDLNTIMENLEIVEQWLLEVETDVFG